MASYFMDNAKIVVIVSLLILGIKTQCPSSGAICTSCIDGCDTCTDNSTCQTCSTQYYAVPIDNTSSLSTCSLCPTKCLVCSTPYVCDSCTPGYDPTTDNSTGYQYCTFIWWKWFLIVFGVLLGIVLIGGLIWWIRSKLKAEQEDKQQVNYEMKQRHQTTQQNIQ